MIIACILLFVAIINQIAALRLSTSHKQTSILRRSLALRAGGGESGIGWDSHIAVDQIPASLVNAIDGNESMRRKFEELCRNAQVSVHLTPFLPFYLITLYIGQYLQSNRRC
jgi:hypothetical protein